MDLSFSKGEVIDVLGVESNDWVNGCSESGRFGSFPKQYIDELIEPLDREHTNTDHDRSRDNVTVPAPPPRPSSNPIIPIATKPTSNSVKAANPSPSLPPRNTTPRSSSNSNHFQVSTNAELGRYTPDNSTQDVLDRLVYNTSSVTSPDFIEPLYWEESDMLELDEYARACPVEYTSSVSDLAAYLTEPFPEPLHKIRAIFAWVTDNISYDVHSFLNKINKSQQPADVLKSRSSVCEGYARLTQALGEASNLPIRQISGYAKGAFLSPRRGMRVDQQGAHAWNSILLHGQYLMIDSTWGAGYLATEGSPAFKKKFNPFYFLTNPSKFIYSHFPKDNRDQYLTPPMDESDFFELPWVQPLYHKYNLLIQSPKPRSPVLETSDDTLDIYVEALDKSTSSNIWGMPAQLKADNGQVISLSGQRAVGYSSEGRMVWWIHVVFNSPGTFNLNLFLGESSGSTNSAQSRSQLSEQLLTMTAINHGRGSAKTPIQVATIPRPITILSPLYQEIPLGTEYFRIVVHNTPGDQTPPPNLSVMSSWQDQQILQIVKQESGEAWYESEITFRQPKKLMLAIEKPTTIPGRKEVSYISTFIVG
ncbi:hypothetical protein VKS41_002694 [Umbelopsis sp. WA50703]